MEWLTYGVVSTVGRTTFQNELFPELEKRWMWHAAAGHPSQLGLALRCVRDN
jgi:hypothetical protein